MTESEAKAGAAALIKKLRGNWEPRVWENIGWHYSAIAADGHITIYPSHVRGYFHCLLSEGERAHTGSCLWSQGIHYEDPNIAVEEVMKRAYRVASKIINHLGNVRDALDK